MTKTVVIDSQISGISGDMLLSSLIDCGANRKIILKNIKKLEKFFQDAKIKKADFIETESNGIRSVKFEFKYEEKVKERKATDLYRIISNCCNNINLTDYAKKFSIESIKTLILTESKIHNKEVKDLHLHESSSIDTGVDIIGCALALDDLDLFRNTIFYCTKVAVGGGLTKFSHGTVSNPTPAIIKIFQNYKLPIIGGPVDTELTTPTGASLLVNLNPCSISFYPEFIIDKIGHGMGSKVLEGIPNILRISIGKSNLYNNINMESIITLETHIDDMDGEKIGNLVDKLSKDSNVNDVAVINGITKKNRPFYIVKIICKEEAEKKIVETIFLETGTLGIRRSKMERYVLKRFNLLIPVEIFKQNFAINVKISKNYDGKVINVKPEFEDLKKISEQLSIPFKNTSEIVNNLIFQKRIYEI